MTVWCVQDSITAVLRNKSGSRPTSDHIRQTAVGRKRNLRQHLIWAQQWLQSRPAPIQLTSVVLLGVPNPSSQQDGTQFPCPILQHLPCILRAHTESLSSSCSYITHNSRSTSHTLQLSSHCPLCSIASRPDASISKLWFCPRTSQPSCQVKSPVRHTLSALMPRVAASLIHKPPSFCGWLCCLWVSVVSLQRLALVFLLMTILVVAVRCESSQLCPGNENYCVCNGCCRTPTSTCSGTFYACFATCNPPAGSCVDQCKADCPMSGGTPCCTGGCPLVTSCAEGAEYVTLWTVLHIILWVTLCSVRNVCNAPPLIILSNMMCQRLWLLFLLLMLLLCCCFCCCSCSSCCDRLHFDSQQNRDLLIDPLRRCYVGYRQGCQYISPSYIARLNECLLLRCGIM